MVAKKPSYLDTINLEQFSRRNSSYVDPDREKFLELPFFPSTYEINSCNNCFQLTGWFLILYQCN